MDPDKLTDAIRKSVVEYSQQVVHQIESSLDKTADKIIDYIRTNAPRSGATNALADSFIKESYGEGANKIVVIYSKTNSGLVHLVEFGFKHRSGKLVAARPFMRPSYESLSPAMLEEIRQIIREAG
jgi:hypothetical protein